MALRIFVFDDDAEIRTLLQTALSSLGYQVTTFADPTEFPFFSCGHCPCPASEPCADLLIADIVMPNIEGLDFFRKLKEGGCRPLRQGNVAIMSGFLTIHYMNDLNELGIHYFRKPFELSEIYAWVEQCQARIEQARCSQAQ